MRRFAVSVACGVAGVILFIDLAAILPSPSPPAMIIRWQLELFDRLMPRAPGEMINFKALVAAPLVSVLVLSVIFYFAFTLIARRR
jgi:hypothetical protein